MVQSYLEKEHDKIDDYLIVACITLLAGFTVLLTISKTNSILSSLAGAFAILSFVISFLFALWHKYRKAIRKDLFEKKKTAIFREFEKDLEALKDHVREVTKLQISNYLLTHLDEVAKDREAVFARLKESMPDTPGQDRLTELYAENITSKISSAHKDYFHSPLEEKRAIAKWIIERWAIKGRYYAFLLGLLAFLVSIFIHILR